MMTITNGLTDIKDFIQRDVIYATFQSGGTWYRHDLHEIKILPDGRIGIYILFGLSDPNSITGIRLYNPAGQIWAEDTKVKIDKDQYAEGILYRFTIRLVQESETT